VKYLNEAERQAYRLFMRDGKLYDAQGNLFDTTNATNPESRGHAIFVMDQNGNIYASNNPAQGKFHHSSFFGGEPVAGAGEIRVENGVLKGLSDRSGHYRPDWSLVQQMKQVILGGLGITDPGASGVRIRQYAAPPPAAPAPSPTPASAPEPALAH
jgi:hypothetical protein